MSKEIVRKQFGAHADAYRTSPVHAKGASLARLVELVQPQADWHALDVATGGGHTAAAFAPHVAQVTASDLTPEMLAVAGRLFEERGLTNVRLELADAEDLPFEASQFDLVTCRIAPHHFSHVDRFLTESYRVLRSAGVLAVVDNVVPAGEAGEYVNRYEKLRDPSHLRALTVTEWQSAFEAAGFQVLTIETAQKRMEFQPWVERMGASPDIIAEVREMLMHAPDNVQDYFQLEHDEETIFFQLTEAIIVGRSSDHSAHLGERS